MGPGIHHTTFSPTVLQGEAVEHKAAEMDICRYKTTQYVVSVKTFVTRDTRIPGHASLALGTAGNDTLG